MTAFILYEKTRYVNVHGQEKGMMRQPRQQSKVERAEEGDMKWRKGKRKEDGLSRRMMAFVLHEKFPYVKVHGEERRTPGEYLKEGKERGKGGKEEEKEEEKQRSVLAYVLGERMPGDPGRVFENEELFVELVGLMTPPCGLRIDELP